MDLYNFYRGIENVIDTIGKDRHDLTLKDYLIMCDPFFNIDFYDEKELSHQIGGKDPQQMAEKALDLQERQVIANEAQAKIMQAQEARKQLEKQKKLEAEEKAAEAKMTISEKAVADAKKLLKEAEKKKTNVQAAKEALAKAEAENEKIKADKAALSEMSVSEEDIASAAAEMDKEVDEMGPIKNMIKGATKVVVIFAVIICMPIVPWILISYYSFKKLYGLYISYIQTY